MKNFSNYTLMVQQNNRGKTCFSATFFATNITWNCPEQNWCLCHEWSAAIFWPMARSKYLTYNITLA